MHAMMGAAVAANREEPTVLAILRQFLGRLAVPGVRRLLENLGEGGVAQAAKSGRIRQSLAGMNIPVATDSDEPLAGAGVDAAANRQAQHSLDQGVDMADPEASVVSFQPEIEDSTLELGVLLVRDREPERLAVRCALENHVEAEAPDAMVDEETEDLVGGLNVCTVDGGDDGELEPQLSSLDQICHDPIMGASSAVGDAEGVVQVLRSIQADAYPEVVLHEKADPGGREQGSIGLDDVLDSCSCHEPFLEFERGLEELDPGQKRFAPMPDELVGA